MDQAADLEDPFAVGVFYRERQLGASRDALVQPHGIQGERPVRGVGRLRHVELEQPEELLAV